jgi:hypothetical protein
MPSRHISQLLSNLLKIVDCSSTKNPMRLMYPSELLKYLNLLFAFYGEHCSIAEADFQNCTTEEGLTQA